MQTTVSRPHDQRATAATERYVHTAAVLEGYPTGLSIVAHS